MKSSKLVFVFTLGILFVACQEKALNPTAPQGPDFSVTPMENEEAELAALHLSGQLIAPVPLYERIKKEFEIIRSTWSDSIQHVNLRFETFWEPSKLYVEITNGAYDSIITSNYHYWDSLNELYRLREKVLSFYYYGSYMILTFEGRLNSLHLGPAYSGMPGFRSLYTTARGGDRSEVWLHMEDDIIKYFFRYGFGDCEAGCAYSDIYYFTVKGDSALFHGSFLLYGGYTEVPPSWLDTALTALREYHVWYHWRAGST